MTSKNKCFFENNQQDIQDKEFYTTTVKITTFTTKEEKWVHHSFEETLTSRGRQLTTFKTTSSKTTTCESMEGLESTILNEYRYY
jgi:hypothetical protein